MAKSCKFVIYLFSSYWFVNEYEDSKRTVLTIKIKTLINGFEKELDIKISGFSRKACQFMVYD